MIILYKGRRGAGKTLTMVKDGLKYFLNGYRILRNFECGFGEYISDEEILDLNKDSEIYNCVIMIDEIQIFFDSRRSMKKQNLLFSNFIQQIRKRNIIVLATSQYSNTVDLRFRQHVDIMAMPNFIKSLDVCEVIYIDLTSVEDMLQGIKEPNHVKVIFDAKPIYKLYQTEEMIR